MKTASYNMERSDSIVAFFAGGFGGTIAWLEIYMLDASFFVSLIKAGATAAVCGFLGVAGKHLYNYVRTKYFSRKKK